MCGRSLATTVRFALVTRPDARISVTDIRRMRLTRSHSLPHFYKISVAETGTRIPDKTQIVKHISIFIDFYIFGTHHDNIALKAISFAFTAISPGSRGSPPQPKRGTS